MHKKVTNTEKTPNPEWLGGVNPEAIENQEAEGQKELVVNEQLPRKCNHPSEITNTDEQYRKMGIKTFPSSKGDDMFLGVKLPDGWKKEATDHSMWSNLVDSNGVVRATIFYKAAFYDRDTFINFKTRYSTDFRIKDEGYFVVDAVTKEELFESDDSKLQGRAKCREFLNENYPQWEDVNAYWD